MKLALISVSLAIVFMLLFGCTGQAPATPSGQEAPAVQPEPVKNVTAKPPEPKQPEFTPVHLYYEFTSPGPNGQMQKVMFNYYLSEKTACAGRPALNGFLKGEEEGRNGANYAKITVYLDTGEAVYSDSLDEPSLAFDSAKERMSDFDAAFYLPTLVARGGKKMLSDEIWNASKPVLLKSVPAFGTSGDYSLMAGGSGKVAGLECKNYTLSVKSANMQGQMAFCIYRLPEPQLALVTSVKFPQEINNVPSWELARMDNEKPTNAFYPQCLQPVSCPSVSMPTQEEHNSCSSQNKTIEPERDSKNCVTAYNCISREEQARKNIAGSQRPGCPVSEELVTQAANCWSQNGNVNYDNDQNSGCITKVNCNLPSQ